MSGNGNQPRICVLGSIIMDVVIPVPQLPRPGETVLGGPPRRYPGGKGANQAVAAARMGSLATHIGAVGDDENGRTILRTMSEERVDVSCVSVDPSGPTGSAVVSVAPDGINAIIVSPGANMSLSPDLVRAARPAIAAADVLVLQLEVPMESAIAAAQIARDSGTTILLNAAPVPPTGVPSELLAATDVLIVNETEAAAMAAGIAAIDAQLIRLANLGPRVVVITLGERGVRYKAEQAEPAGLDAFTVQAVDSTGAGDAFVGTFATRWAEHQIGGALDRMGVMDAVCWGAAAGALAATGRGAMPSLPHRQDVIHLLRGRGAAQ